MQSKRKGSSARRVSSFVTLVVVCRLVVLVPAISCSAHLKGEDPQQIKEACRRYVQGFYDWYAPTRPERDSLLAPWEVAVKNQGFAFDPKLVHLLEKVEDETTRSGDAGLDFDPFLGSQDPAVRYVVRNTTIRGEHYWADVYGIWSPGMSKKSEEPDVVVELRFMNGRWLFVNFHYNEVDGPGPEDLLSALSAWR